MAKRASRRTSTPTKATSGKVWRQAKEEGELWTLPSGNVARLRTVSLMHLLRNGEIPDALTPIAASMIWSTTDADDIAGNVEIAKASADLAELLCTICFLDPVIADDPQEDNEVSLAHIDDMDKAWVMNTMIQPAAVLRGFREKQAQRLANVRDGDEDGPEAE